MLESRSPLCYAPFMANHLHIDLTGCRFGRLIVLRRVFCKKYIKWDCRCDCGIKKEILAIALRAKGRNRTRSCGFLATEILLIRNHRSISPRFIHGHARKGKFTPEYSTWMSMRERCNNPKHEAYKNYGGRGISVC